MDRNIGHSSQATRDRAIMAATPPDDPEAKAQGTKKRGGLAGDRWTDIDLGQCGPHIPSKVRTRPVESNDERC